MDAIEVVRTLTEILLWQKADDKIDIAFTVSSDQTRMGSSDELANYLRLHLPTKREMPGRYQSNPADAVGKILRRYSNNLSSSKVKAFFNKHRHEPGHQALSLYILTDGRFQERSDLVEPIQKMIDVLDENKKDKRHVGVQFIRFGNDPAGMQRLRDLDNGKGLHEGRRLSR